MNVPHVEPAIVEMPSSINADVATAVNLSCLAEGYPPPTYQWYKDRAVIHGETKSFLYITETLPNNRGSYSCHAYNSRGRTSSDSATINVSGIINISVRTFYHCNNGFFCKHGIGVKQFIVTLMLNQSTTNQAFDEVLKTQSISPSIS